MLNGHPKGLFVLAATNTGERFGFYTMMAILTLFLMSKFGIDGEQAGLTTAGVRLQPVRYLVFFWQQFTFCLSSAVL